MQVEGVTYDIRWRSFRKGTAIFIPCLNPRRAKQQVLVETDRLGIKILMQVVIVEGVRGLRVWRM